MKTEGAPAITAPRVALIAAGVATLLAAGLHILFGVSAGALWRDEVNSLEVASVRTLGELWHCLDFDSFPALFFLVLRPFVGVPAEISDAGLRVFGVVIGLLILGAIWMNARWFRLGAPLLSLALIGFNPMVIRYSDSIRAYGLGTLLMLLTIGAIWKFVETGAPWRLLLALLAALLAVQTLYYNAVLLFAICLAGVAVNARRREWQRGASLLAIGAICALSMLPYLPTIKHVRSWNFQFKAEIGFAYLWGKLSETLGSPIAAANWIWVGLLALALVAAVANLWPRSSDEATRVRQDRMLFASVMLVIGVLGYAIFLRVLSYPTQPWYYVAFVAFGATCLEIIFASLPPRTFVSGARLAFALLFIGCAIFPATQELELRQSNIDTIAARLHSLAKKDDLILINTWNYGISFRRYYQGPATSTTIPPIADLRFHRCDLSKFQMTQTDPLAPVLRQIGATLSRGHDVWLIGALDFVPPGERPAVVAPGHDGEDGWVGEGFYPSWSQQTSYFLQNHILGFERVLVPVPRTVIKFENLPLSRFHGFRETASL
ncbi:MAG: hypothetical protein ACR2HH_12755 [Chthoniobacterales bacterium]